MMKKLLIVGLFGGLLLVAGWRLFSSSTSTVIHQQISRSQSPAEEAVGAAPGSSEFDPAPHSPAAQQSPDQADDDPHPPPSPGPVYQQKRAPTSVHFDGDRGERDEFLRAFYRLAEEQSAALAGWPNAKLIDVRIDKQPDSGLPRRTFLLQPADLPYPVRVEEVLAPSRRNANALPEWRVISEIVADRILSRVPPERDFEGVRQAILAAGAKDVRRLTESGIIRIDIPDPSIDSVFEAIASFSDLPLAFVEPDPIVRTMLTPNDLGYLDGSLWGLHNYGQNGGVADADIDAPEGWDLRVSASNIIIGVIDTGVRYTHVDILPNMWVNTNEVADGLDTDGNGYVDDIYGINAITGSGDPMDDHRHGTHVAGTIAARGNNTVNIAGVAWEAKIMALKFLGANGSGSTSDAITCLDYARQRGARLTNNSWGGGQPSEAMRLAIRDAANAGMLFVAAAGNDGLNNDVFATYPANYKERNIIAVAATDRNDAKADFSNYGIGTVHVGAPGVDILSLGASDDTTNLTLSGTSMASPHVAGIAALLHAHFPSDSAGQIYNRLMRSVEVIPALAERTLSGGRVNLRKALETVSNTPFNNEFANARTIDASDFSVQMTYENATSELSNLSDGVANGRTVWFRFTAKASGTAEVTTRDSSFDTIIGVYTGSSINALTQIALNDNQGTNVTSATSFSTIVSNVYYIGVAGKGVTNGFLNLTLTGPLVNDNLANAVPMIGMPSGLGTKHNLSATKEPGEPNHAGNAGGKSVWGKFQPANDGYYTITTGGEASFYEFSTFDTLVAVYEGPAENPTFASLTLVAENDDDPSGLFNTSLVSFYGEAGKTYYIALDGKNGASGYIRMILFPMAAHALFTNAMVLNGDEHAVNSNNRIATTEPGEPHHGGFPPRYTLWYDWTPSSSGTFEIDTVVTLGSRTSHDTLLAVYTGNALTNLTLVAQDTAQSYGWPNTYDSLVSFNAVSGQSYKIVTGLRGNEVAPLLGPSGLRIRKVEPILNDNFADAIAIPNPIGDGVSTVTGRNRGATFEIGEPPYTLSGFSSNTVWWKWTANQTTQMMVNTIGSSFMTLLWVYTGDSVSNLTQQAFNWGGGDNLTSFATFNAVAGTTYYFRVSGHNNDSGSIVLNLGRYRIPGDNFDDALEVAPDFFYSTYPSGVLSVQPGEPAHGGTTNYSRSLWFRFTPTAETTGTVTFSSQGSQITTIGVYTGASLTSLVAITSSTGFAGSGQAQVTWNAVSGRTYHIALALQFTGGLPYPYCVTFARLRNDNFAGAISLTGNAHQVVAHNFGATKESGESNHAGNAGGRSVWFNWTPHDSGTYRISTRGSNRRIFVSGALYQELDTLLAVYTGTAVNAVGVVAQNDDIMLPNKLGRRNVISEVYFTAASGTTYRIAVDGYRQDGQADWGQIYLNITPFSRPAHDNFTNAIVIPSGALPFIQSTDLSNNGATTEPGEPTHGGSSARSKNTLWYRFTAPEDGVFYASNAGNLYDENRARNAVIAVYRGPALGSLTQVTANVGTSIPDGVALAQFSAVQGQTYHIAVGTEYAGNLSFILTKMPQNNNFTNAARVWGSSFIASGHNVGADHETGEYDPYWGSYTSRSGPRRSVWWKWTAPVSGTYLVDTYFSQLWVELSIHSESAGPTNPPLWYQQGVPSDGINGVVLGDRSANDRRARGTMTTTFAFDAGQTYYFRVAGAGQSDHIGLVQLEVSGPPSAPPAPIDFDGVRLTTNLVRLTWTDLSSDESGYELQRSLDGTNWIGLAALPANMAEYLDSSAPAQTLYYRLRATNSVGPSAWASLTLPYGALYTLTYIAGTNGSISGTSPQTVPEGHSGTSVLAVPNLGYRFIQWSDGRTTNPRTDTNVMSDLTVTALFGSNAPPTIAGSKPRTVTMSRDGSPLPFNLMISASDPDDPGSSLSWSILVPPANGVASASGVGSSKIIGFTPDSGWTGTNAFVVRVSDPHGMTDTVTVVVNVMPPPTETLVHDPFSDNDVTDGADPLDVAWTRTGSTNSSFAVVTDSHLDPIPPNRVMEFAILTTNQDNYIYFTLPQTIQLQTGQTVRLSFNLRHTADPRNNEFRTGFGLAYTLNNAPWAHVSNQEYMVRTTWGNTNSSANYRIVRTRGVQLINNNTSDVWLASAFPGVSAGTNSVSAWFEIKRTGTNEAVLRLQLGTNAIVEATDTGAASYSNSGIVTQFNRVFFRFATHPNLPVRPTFMLDEVKVELITQNALTPYQVWVGAHTGDTGPEQDYSGDGVPNLLAYALGYAITNPVPDWAMPNIGIMTVGQTNRFVRFIYRRNMNATDITYHVDDTDALIAPNWADVESLDGVTDEFLQDLGDNVELRERRIPAPSAHTNRFFRLRVTMP